MVREQAFESDTRAQLLTLRASLPEGLSDTISLAATSPSINGSDDDDSNNSNDNIYLIDSL